MNDLISGRPRNSPSSWIPTSWSRCRTLRSSEGKQGNGRERVPTHLRLRQDWYFWTESSHWPSVCSFDWRIPFIYACNNKHLRLRFWPSRWVHMSSWIGACAVISRLTCLDGACWAVSLGHGRKWAIVRGEPAQGDPDISPAHPRQAHAQAAATALSALEGPVPCAIGYV